MNRPAYRANFPTNKQTLCICIRIILNFCFCDRYGYIKIGNSTIRHGFAS